MATLIVETDTLIVRLTWRERLTSLRWAVTVPMKDVMTVRSEIMTTTIPCEFSERIMGTGRHRASAGPWGKYQGGRAMVAISGFERFVVIELYSNPSGYRLLALSTPDADACANRIAAATGLQQ